MLKPDDRAPDFSGVTDEGHRFKLADYAGKNHVVLYFYPKDFTAGCTREACSFRDDYMAITAEGSVLFGVSADSVESHKAFKEKYQLPFALIADPDRSLAKLYGVSRGLLGLSPTQRVTYLIDKGGIIRGVFHHELAITKHREDILEGLQKLNIREARDATAQ